MEREPFRKWYNKRYWRDRLQPFIINRDPICKICDRYPSTVADHIKPHRGIWALFSNAENLQGVCKTCHDIKTAKEDGGFGHTHEVKPNEITGTTVGKDLIDAALADIDKIADLDV